MIFKTMLKNYNHDLIHQLSEISDSLWRIKDYLKNAKDCDCCIKLWKKIQADLERISKMLIKEIQIHCKENCFE